MIPAGEPRATDELSEASRFKYIAVQWGRGQVCVSGSHIVSDIASCAESEHVHGRRERK